MVHQTSKIPKILISLFAIIIVVIAGSVTLSFSGVEPFNQIFPQKSSSPPKTQDIPDIPIIAVYGDSRTGHTMHQKIVNDIMTYFPDVVLHVGDLVNDGNSSSDWAIFDSITSTMRASAAFYPALGNHENNSPLYFSHFVLPNNERWYSVDYNIVHLIALDSAFSSLAPGSEQYQWLANDLQSVDQANKFIIVYFHHPIFTTAGSDNESLKASLTPLFQNNSVDLIFTGHMHIYERSLYNNILYYVSGGGGAPLSSQTRTSPYSKIFVADNDYVIIKINGSDTLLISSYDDDNNLIDEVRLSLSHACT